MLTTPRLAITAWAAWLFLLAALASLLFLRIWHPHFFPVTALLLVFTSAGTVLIGKSIWHIARGPRRTRSVTWLLIGMAPLWFMAGHFLYGLQVASGRSVPLTYSLKMLVPLGESLMDLESRFRFPCRTVGAKVVMISQPMENAAAQVAAMDEHVRQIEMRLGRQLEERVHWVRGPLLGLQGKAIVGLCMGTRSQEAVPDEQGLDSLDRHEVAHCVINMLCPPSSEPPALLLEGWAEANSGHDAQWLADRAWKSRELGQTLPLQSLSGPAWAGSHTAPVYVQGGPLVNYLLQKFGAEKFFRLYTSSRRSTFASDCRRYLGAELKDIENAYWADIEQLVHHDGSPSRRRLTQLTLGPAIDRSAWLEFLDRYFTTVPRWLAEYDLCELTVNVENRQTDLEGEVHTNSVRYISTRSGPWHSLVIEGPHEHQVYVAHPRHSFKATRKSANEPWVIRRTSDIGQEQIYRSMRHEIDTVESFGETAVLLADDMQSRLNVSDLVVTRLERFREGEERLVRLRLEDCSRHELAPWRAATFVLSENGFFVLRSSDYEEGSLNGVLRSEVTYEPSNGKPAIHFVTTTRRDRDGRLSKCIRRVVKCQFGPTAQEAFSAEQLLGPGFVEGPPLGAPHDAVAVFGTDWSRWFFGTGTLSLLIGLGLLCWEWRTDRSRTALRRSGEAIESGFGSIPDT